MRWRKILVIVVGLLVVLPIAGIGIFIATLDPNDWKPRIQNAVIRATGRELSLNGPISLKWSLVPTIEAQNVALANFDGGSRPQMVTAQSIEAEVALLPLLSHHLDIHRLAIIKPDVLIETTQAGRGNWLFTKPATPTDAPTAAAAPGAPMDIDVQSMTVEDGTLTWRNGITGQAVTGTLNSFELLEPSETSPVTFQLVAIWAGNSALREGRDGSDGAAERYGREDTVAGEAVNQLERRGVVGECAIDDAPTAGKLFGQSKRTAGGSGAASTFRSGHAAAVGAGAELQRECRG